METKFIVCFARPVIERLSIETHAASEEEAVLKAVETLKNTRDCDWSGKFDSENYTMCVDSVEEFDNEEDAVEFDQSFQNEARKYLILQADTDSGEGSIVPQPWLMMQSALMVADLNKDWSSQLIELEQVGFDEFIRTAGPKKNAKIIPFPTNKTT